MRHKLHAISIYIILYLTIRFSIADISIGRINNYFLNGIMFILIILIIVGQTNLKKKIRMKDYLLKLEVILIGIISILLIEYFIFWF
jgi:hypothetical protein